MHILCNISWQSWLPLAVSNAGMGLIGPIECQSIDEMKTVMDTNFFGLVRLLKEVLPDMKRRKRGHIVVISSVMGIQGETVTSVHHESICLKCLHIVLTMSHSLLLFQGFYSTTSMRRPSLQWKAFVKVWRYKPWGLISSKELILLCHFVLCWFS